MKYLIVLCLLLCSCSAPINYTQWNKPESSIDDFKKDSYDCEKDSALIPLTPITPGLFGAFVPLADEQKKKDMFIRCMESKGWTLAK